MPSEFCTLWLFITFNLHLFSLFSVWLWLITQVKSMTLHVSHLDKNSVPRRSRFSDRFKDDVSTIVSVVTAEIGTILVKQHKVSSIGGRAVSCYLFAVSIADKCRLLTVCVHPVLLGVSVFSNRKVLMTIRLSCQNAHN